MVPYLVLAENAQVSKLIDLYVVWFDAPHLGNLWADFLVPIRKQEDADSPACLLLVETSLSVGRNEIVCLDDAMMDDIGRAHDQMHKIFVHVKQAIGKLSLKYTGEMPGASNAGEIVSIAIQNS